MSGKKPLEDVKTDAFLNEIHKKRVSDEIWRYNKEKKLQHEPLTQEVTSLNLSHKTKIIANISFEIVAILQGQAQKDYRTFVITSQEQPQRDSVISTKDLGIVTNVIQDLLQVLLSFDG
ncbi:hypothetical protein C1645_829408 [Glomus cerebriforme]|uniref:Uncharacterized protein n=1 Tax=Glomus cerebriforme TaxID=658196 RepID=A0A397SN67_9GLOM|nr:hypothetical protein C1645_829408 [Glomus cerebriforme]